MSNIDDCEWPDEEIAEHDHTALATALAAAMQAPVLDVSKTTEEKKAPVVIPEAPKPPPKRRVILSR